MINHNSRKALIIIPCYNESQNIGNVIDELRRDVSGIEILCVNDASTDDTEQILKSKNVSYLTLPFNLGYAGALQAGFQYAKYRDYDFVIQFDGDGQHIAAEINQLFEEFSKSQSDIVIGSRFLLNTGYKHSIIKKIAIYIFRVCIKAVSGRTITDPTSGFQLLSKRVYVFYSSFGNFPQFPDANLILEMAIRGYKITEVGVKMRPRIHGQSMHSGIIKPFKYMLHMFFSLFVLILNYNKLKQK